MKELVEFSTPQLPTVHQGKVRESLRVDDQRRLIVVTDRISCFDRNLETVIPNKGIVLNGLSNAWFFKTRHIIENHVINVVDLAATLVKEAEPIRLEMIVRKYLTGSLWRKYEAGQRELCGIFLPDGMSRNEVFSQPIITPTTKSAVDEDISPEEIIETGLVSPETYAEMKIKALELFAFGSKLCKSKGVILVDTKYEFGLLDGKLILIDEIHTPDSSRFWLKTDYEANPNSEQWMDKEFIRRWLLDEKAEGREHLSLPQEIVSEAARRYDLLYQTLMGKEVPKSNALSKERLLRNLQHIGLMKEAYVVLVVASREDLEHAKKLKKSLKNYPVAVFERMVSAYKNGEEIVSMMEEYDCSAESGAIIATAGLSNGLGGALSANTVLPVINCPPFQDKADIFTAFHSFLMTPCEVPVATIIDPDNAVKFAIRALNMTRVKEQIKGERLTIKNTLKEEDEKLKKQSLETCLTRDYDLETLKNI